MMIERGEVQALATSCSGQRLGGFAAHTETVDRDRFYVLDISDPSISSSVVVECLSLSS
jgi:hypothetical protein